MGSVGYPNFLRLLPKKQIKDLRVITGASTIDGGGVATGAGGGDTFLIQKFVKSKGPHAFIIRQVSHPIVACNHRPVVM